VNRTFRAHLLALLTLVLALSAPLDQAAAGSRVLRAPDDRAPGDRGAFTRGEARAVLTQAKRQLRTDTRRVRAHRPVGRGAQTEITMTLRDLYLARTALTGAERRDADTLLSRSRSYTDGSTDPITVSTPATQCSTNFCVHYRPTTLAPLSESATAAQVQTTLSTLEQVRTYETRTLGYRTPVADTPTAPSTDNPDARFDVFLGDLAQQGLYGYCAPDGDQPEANGHTAAFCVLDNDYARAQYGTAPINALRVTAAHEFFHAVQFAYDVREDLWFMEGTAAWVEDEVYDAIDDNYQFLAASPLRAPRRAVDYSLGMYPYGSFLFFTYVSERLRNRGVIRQFWEYADGPRNRYSLQAIRAVLAARRTSWPAFFSVFASWNTLPAGSYSERAGYPAPALTLSRTLTKRARTTGWRTVALPHLSSSAIRVAPHQSLNRRKNLLIEVNGPDTSHGTTALVQRRYRNGAVAHSLMSLNGFGNGRLLIRFDRRALASVVVVVSNTSTAMRDCGRVGDAFGSPVYSCFGRGSYDQGQNFAVRATVR
jgi:hypothetical protein